MHVTLARGCRSEAEWWVVRNEQPNPLQCADVERAGAPKADATRAGQGGAKDSMSEIEGA